MGQVQVTFPISIGSSNRKRVVRKSYVMGVDAAGNELRAPAGRVVSSQLRVDGVASPDDWTLAVTGPDADGYYTFVLSVPSGRGYAVEVTLVIETP